MNGTFLLRALFAVQIKEKQGKTVHKRRRETDIQLVNKRQKAETATKHYMHKRYLRNLHMNIRFSKIFFLS